jgi:hypothetical protein
MAEERKIEFRDIPNTYTLWRDKVSVSTRKVLIEKTQPSTENSIYAHYYASFMEFELQRVEGELRVGRADRINIIEELEKPRVLFEKNLQLIKSKRGKLEARKQFINKFLSIKFKSVPEETTSDITSLENIDFNSPVTKEQEKELKKLLDHYVYREAIDEIDCEIKERDEEGVDVVRMNYGQHWKDRVAIDLTEFFTERQTIRLSDDYMDKYFRELDYRMSRALKRKVLIEKTGYDFFSWKKRGFVNLDYTERRAYFNTQERKLEYQYVAGEIHRRLTPPSDINFR